jgi:hypothetical protein
MTARRMKSARNSRKIGFGVLAGCVLLAMVEFGSQAGAHTQEEQLSPQQMRGKRIYLSGEVEGGEIWARIRDLDIPATTLVCAGCHGLSGEGKREGGILAPPLYWESLTSGGTSDQRNPGHKAYDEQSVARAIREGVGTDSRHLNSAMPHYQLTPAQMADLIAYLKTLHE